MGTSPIYLYQNSFLIFRIFPLIFKLFIPFFLLVFFCKAWKVRFYQYKKKKKNFKKKLSNYEVLILNQLDLQYLQIPKMYVFLMKRSFSFQVIESFLELNQRFLLFIFRFIFNKISRLLKNALNRSFFQ